jgi:acyl carrier protein
MERNAIKPTVRSLIAGLIPEETEFTDDESLFIDGIGLNSLSTMELLVNIESLFSIEIQDADLNLNNLGSVNAITDLISRYTA